MDIFYAYATDESLENNGVWRKLGAAEFLLGRVGNKRFSKSLTEQVEQNKAVMDLGGEAAAKMSDEIMINALAAGVLLGWKPGLKFKGEPLGEYSTETARKLLSLKDFRKAVQAMADDMEAYLIKEEAQQGEA